MNFLDIKTLDIANGPGCRISLFVSGCRRHCKDCFNPESWDFNHGEPFTEEVASKILELLKPDYITGLSILGGEPFEVENQLVLHSFLWEVRTRYPKKSIWVYTGYTIEEILCSELAMNTGVPQRILSTIDVLVDGEFVSEKKDIKLQYCGSRNQRVIDVPTTMKTKIITVYDPYRFSEGPMGKVGGLYLPKPTEADIFKTTYLCKPFDSNEEYRPRE